CGLDPQQPSPPLRQQRQQRKRTRLFAQSDGRRHRSRGRRDDWGATKGRRRRSRRAAHGLLCASCHQSCSGGAEADRARGAARPRSSRHGAMGETVRGRGRDASETTVKRLRLADYRVVYFATHGLVAGDIKGLAEPSLALSIPAQSSDLDDGLLTLNADWVVLSACNTIAGDKPGAEALSGLARAFFYAGARALLVSHWAVESNAAMRLTTSTFDIMKKDPTLGRAEALRRSMLAYMNDTANPLNAYPALWAPFVVVGEGAGRPVAAMR